VDRADDTLVTGVNDLKRLAVRAFNKFVVDKSGEILSANFVCHLNTIDDKTGRTNARSSLQASWLFVLARGRSLELG